MSLVMQKDTSPFSPSLGFGERKRSIQKSRKSSESENFNSNKILEEFEAGVVYGKERSRKESFAGRGSLEKDKLILEESPDVRRRKSSGLERETKGIFSDRKKRLSTSKMSGIFAKPSRLPLQNLATSSKKVEVVYSKCMVAISTKFFNNLKNDTTLVNNDKLLHFMSTVLSPICTLPRSPFPSTLKSAIFSIFFPFDQTGVSLLLYNLLILATKFPILEKPLLEKIITFAIKLDCDLRPSNSSQSSFPVPGNISTSSVFQASIYSLPNHIIRPNSTKLRSSFLERMSIFSQFPVSSEFCGQASAKLETVLLLLSLFTKSRLQIDPDFSSFFRDPQLTPLLHRFTQTLRQATQERVLLSSSQDIQKHRIQYQTAHQSQSTHTENPEIQDKRNLVDLLIDLFSKKILNLKQPHLIQFYIFISISLKTPQINKHPRQDYFKEQFFEKLILNLFNISVHTPAKLASLNYIQGFLSNSRRVSSRLYFIVLNYLLKLTQYFFKKARKNIRNIAPKDLTQTQFAKYSKMRRSKILSSFSNQVLARVIMFQARILAFAVKDLQPNQYGHLVKGHEDFLKKNQK